MSKLTRQIGLSCLVAVSMSATVSAKMVDFNTVMDHLVASQVQHTREKIIKQAQLSAKNAVNHYGYLAQPTHVSIKDLQTNVTTRKVGFTATSASK